MEKLNLLISKCKASVSIHINDHHNRYQSVEEYFEEQRSFREDVLEDIEVDVYDKMVELNTIINIHFYPDTPVGFYSIYHYDLETAIDLALECLK